jgi:integrase
MTTKLTKREIERAAKKEAARAPDLEAAARLTQLPEGKAQVRIGMGQRLHCLIRRNANGSTSRYWVCRYTVAGTGKAREMSFGLVELTSLAEVRAKVRAEIAKPLHEGVADPFAKKAEDKAAAEALAKGPPTLREVFEEFIRSRRATWRNAKTLGQWQEVPERFCAAIDDDDVLAVLQPHWHAIPTTAARVRAHIEAVLGFAMARKYRPRGFNPAAWKHHLQNILPSPSTLAEDKALAKRPSRHFPALPFGEVGDLMAKLAAKPGSVALAMRFAVLTAARSAEVRFARWQEIDLKAGLWSLPATRMKAKRPHVVPLSPQALDVLSAAAKLRDGDFVFPGDVEMAEGGRHAVSDASMLMALRTFHPSATVHGFRSSFKDWAVEQTEHDNALSEMALAHKVGSAVELSYRRSDQRDQRRVLMCQWASFIAPYTEGNVVTLPRRGRR